MKYNKILFIFILVLFLVGCGGSKPEPETPQPENPGVEDPEEPEQPKEVVFETDEEYIELGIYEKHELNITIENVEDYELEYSSTSYEQGRKTFVELVKSLGIVYKKSETKIHRAYNVLKNL